MELYKCLNKSKQEGEGGTGRCKQMGHIEKRVQL